MATAYDPAQIDLPTIILMGTTYTLAELDATRERRVRALGKELDAIQRDSLQLELAERDGGDRPERTEDELVDAAMRVCCDIIEAKLQGATGLGDRLFGAWQSDLVTEGYLTRTAAWIEAEGDKLEAAGKASAPPA